MKGSIHLKVVYNVFMWLT